MADKKFSDFTHVAAKGEMQVVGLKGGANALSTESVYLMTKAEFDSLAQAVSGFTSDLTALSEDVVKLQGDQAVAGVKTFSSNVLTSAAQGSAANSLARKDYVDSLVRARKKSEVEYAAMTTAVDGTGIDLVLTLKALTPVSGTLLPFFNTTKNKLTAFNEDSSLYFKVSFTGSWSGGSTNRSLQLDFIGTKGNRQTVSRDAPATPPDIVTISTFFSVDKNGFIATNGTQIILKSLGDNFTLTGVNIIAEQVVLPASVMLPLP